MSICGWVVASGSGGRSLASGSWHQRVVTASLASGREYREGCIWKGASGSGSSKIDIGMRAAGSWQLAVGTGPW